MLTRSNLRDEFAMVDDVFALSPISASPALPSEADYEAIRDAFMETSRGRWFLGEYAKRNRNADTSMVLDAVARIEQALAAQQRLQQQQESQEVDDSALPEALAAIRHAVTSAQGAASAALGGFALEQNLSPVRKGIRIIKEISWRWREIGADSRICDLIDSQVVAIEAACDQLAGADPSAALMAAFDLIKAQIDGLDQTAAIAPVTDGTETPAVDMAQPAGVAGADHEPSSLAAGSAAQEEASAPAATAAEDKSVGRIESPVATPPVTETAAAPVALMTPAAPAATFAPSPAPVVAEAAVAPEPAKPEPAPAKAVAEPAPAKIEPAQAKVEPAQAVLERPKVLVEADETSLDDDDLDIVVVSKADADAQDEALLELVAAEMSLSEPVTEKEIDRATSIHFDIEDPVSVDDDIVATFAEPPAQAAKPEQPRVVAAPQLAPAPAPPEPRPAVAVRPVPVAPQPAPVPQPAPAMQAPLQAMSAVQELARQEQPRQELPRQELARPTPLAQQPVVQEQPRPVVAATVTLHPLPKPTPQPSLGATLIANGLLQRPVAANDPLTPIRRMTQPEKIAFFS